MKYFVSGFSRRGLKDGSIDTDPGATNLFPLSNPLTTYGQPIFESLSRMQKLLDTYKPIIVGISILTML
jgi:hypothetical protein